jgi:ABC-type Zn2+ transport system substrate-binding protein/surface adhesin
MLLNEFIKERRKVEQQRKDFEAALAQQQKQIEALTARLQKVAGFGFAGQFGQKFLRHHECRDRTGWR